MVRRSSKSATEHAAQASSGNPQRRSPQRRQARTSTEQVGDETEFWPSAEDVDPEQSVRERRHPSALAEAVDTDASDTAHPVEQQAHPRPPKRHSGTLADPGDEDDLPVHEPGAPLEPESLGAQFLRDATEQDNFESQRLVSDQRGEPAIEPVVSEASLEGADQQEVDWPTSSALEVEQPDEASELRGRELDVRSDVLREASLLDQGIDADASDDDVEEAKLPASGRTQTHSPELRTDDVPVPEGRPNPRHQEQRRMRRKLRKQRPRPHEAEPESVR